MGLQENIRQMAANDLFEELPQIAEDMESIPNGQASMDFIGMLVEGSTPEEAITFASYVLTPRLAVWWAHECVRAHPELLAEQDHHMLGLAAAWVSSMSDTESVAAMDASTEAKDRTVGVWVAMAAGFSGTSMVAPEFGVSPPPPFVTGRLVNASILTLLALLDPADRRQKITDFVGMAQMLANSD